jgi:hypothetical protein
MGWVLIALGNAFFHLAAGTDAETALIRTVAPPRAIVEEVTWGIPGQPENQPGHKPHVRVIQPPRAFGHVPCTFFDAREVCDRWDVLGDDLASLHYEVHLLRVGIG